MELIDSNARYLPEGGGRTLWTPWGPVTYKVTTGQTSGAYSLFEWKIRPRGRIPPHIEHREDECLYVVEGEFEFLKDEEVLRAGPGASVYVPRGVVHAFENVGSASGRVLNLFTPGGTRALLRGDRRGGRGQRERSGHGRITGRRETRVRRGQVRHRDPACGGVAESGREMVRVGGNYSLGGRDHVPACIGYGEPLSTPRDSRLTPQPLVNPDVGMMDHTSLASREPLFGPAYGWLRDEPALLFSRRLLRQR